MLLLSTVPRHARTPTPVSSQMQDAVVMDDFDKGILHATLTMQVARGHMCEIHGKPWALDIFSMTLTCA